VACRLTTGWTAASRLVGTSGAEAAKQDTPFEWHLLFSQPRCGLLERDVKANGPCSLLQAHRFADLAVPLGARPGHSRAPRLARRIQYEAARIDCELNVRRAGSCEVDLKAVVPVHGTVVFRGPRHDGAGFGTPRHDGQSNAVLQQDFLGVCGSVPQAVRTRLKAGTSRQEDRPIRQSAGEFFRFPTGAAVPYSDQGWRNRGAGRVPVVGRVRGHLTGRLELRPPPSLLGVSGRIARIRKMLTRISSRRAAFSLLTGIAASTRHSLSPIRGGDEPLSRDHKSLGLESTRRTDRSAGQSG
jgi:hypothetical protein